MPISTSNATTTTNADMINPCIIGRIPAFLSFENEVFKPIAANALTMRNLLTFFEPDTIAEGIENTLVITDMARKPRMNQGNILLILKLALSSLPSQLLSRAYFFLSLS